MPEATTLAEIGFLSVWLLGLSVGLTACSAVCLPFMGSWVMGRGRGGVDALKDAGAFAAGKILAYTGLGGLAGWMGEALLDLLAGDGGHLLIGLASLAAAGWLVWPRRSVGCSGRPVGAGMPPLLMGFTLSLTPCAPLAALLAAAALGGDAVAGLGYGLCFGLGAALTPLFVVLPMLGALGRNLRDGRPWLGKWVLWGAALVLAALGVRRILFVV